jgi:hypothetical protein
MKNMFESVPFIPSSAGKKYPMFILKVKDTLIENDSSKSESHPVKYYLSTYT